MRNPQVARMWRNSWAHPKLLVCGLRIDFLCQNYTEQYKGAAAHTVTTRLQYAKVRDRWKMVIMREGERRALPLFSFTLIPVLLLVINISNLFNRILVQQQTRDLRHMHMSYFNWYSVILCLIPVLSP